MNLEGGAVAISLLALVGGAISFLYGLATRREADAAQRVAAAAQERATKASEDAADALAKSAAAARESADALKQANEIAQRQLPFQGPVWKLRRVAGGRWGFFNDSPSGATAFQALVEGAGEHPELVTPEENLPRDVPVGDVLTFRAPIGLGVGDPVVCLSIEVNGERVGTVRTLYQAES